MSKDLEKKVEAAMPQEDGEDAQQKKLKTSFVSPEQEEKGPSMADVFLYMAKKLKSIDENISAIAQGKTIIESPKKKVEPPQKKEETASAVEVSTGESLSVSEAKSDAIEDVKMMFPEDLENLLTFSEKEGYVTLKPRQFLGSDNFAKIAAIVRGIGGEYVSAGKESHFRISLSQLGKSETKPAVEEAKAKGTPKPQPEIAGEPPRLVELKKALGDLLDLVTINMDESTLMFKIKPRQFLGSDNFAKIASVVRNLGGDYVSQGKESHFNVPKNA